MAMCLLSHTEIAWRCWLLACWWIAVFLYVCMKKSFAFRKVCRCHGDLYIQ